LTTNSNNSNSSNNIDNNKRAEIRELISSGNGDANNHWFQIDPAGGGGGFAITQINGIVNNTFDRTDLDAFAEPTDEIELIVGGANANPGDIAIMGVIYT